MRWVVLGIQHIVQNAIDEGHRFAWFHLIEYAANAHFEQGYVKSVDLGHGVISFVRQSIMDKGTELGLPSDHTLAMLPIGSHSSRLPKCCTFAFPVPGKQIIKFLCRIVDYATKHVGKPGLRIDILFERFGQHQIYRPERDAALMMNSTQ